MKYERQPGRIYQLSFATVRSEADLSRFTPAQADVAVRIIHSCGMTCIGAELEFSERFEEAGREALLRGAAIHCDGHMSAAGIIKRLLPAGNRIVVSVDCNETAERARRLQNTRSAAAVDAWLPSLGGSVVVIGNAPTALFRLLELVEGGGPVPSLVIAFPVGFVGAAESKAELVSRPRPFEYLTLPGRKGGSAMAAAALNAIATACCGRGKPAAGTIGDTGQ